MIVKGAEYKKVMKEFNQRVSDAVYGCDECKKEFGEDKILVIRVFHHESADDVDKYEFCSWKCLFKFLPKVQTDYFIELPYLTYDAKINGTSAKDFINLVAKID